MSLIRVIAALVVISTVPAHAASDSLVALAVGAQYGFVSGEVSDAHSEAPEHQYGFITRLKLVRFVGLEFAGQLDHDPKTQRQRLLSPRYQVSLMANVFPSDYVNVFVAGGLAAHTFGDLFDANASTTSYHVGPGLEFFLGPHLALGGDVRVRVPNAAHVKASVKDKLSAEPINGLLDVWQANLTISYYL